MSRIPTSQPWSIILLLVTSFLVGACSLIGGGNNSKIGSVTLLQGNATLVCSQECRDRGQCGTTQEQGDVVLLNSFIPAANNHDVAIPVTTQVAITGVMTETMFSIPDATQTFPLYYYNVTAADSSFGWVAGWCIQGE